VPKKNLKKLQKLMKFYPIQKRKKFLINTVKKVKYEIVKIDFNCFFALGLKAGGGGGGGPGAAGQQFFYSNVDPHQTFRMFFVRTISFIILIKIIFS
jgi:hypothetical protein